MTNRVLAVAILGALSLAGCSKSDGSVSNQTGPVATAAPSEPASEPAATIVESSTSAQTTTTSSTTTVPATVYDFSAVGPIVQDFVNERGLNGAGLVIVDRDDGIVHEEYWGEFGPDRVSLFASSSKSIVAGVLLRLADRGVLDLDAPIAKAVDWGAANPDITPVQLLSNSSGLVGLAPDSAYAPYICQFRPQGDLQSCGASIFTTTADDGDVVAPDTEYRYGGGQWQVAGALAEAVSGKTWSELVDETYVEPCGVDSLGFNNQWTQSDPIDFVYPEQVDGDVASLGPTDNPNIEAGGYSTARDYAELLLMQLRDGRCGDSQVLTPASVERLHRDRIAEVSAAIGEPRPQLPGYALGWAVDGSFGGYLIDPGAYGSVPWLDLADGYGAYLVIEADNGSGQELAARLYGPVDDAMTRAG